MSAGIRWVARGSGVVLTALFCLFVVGQGFPNLAAQPVEVVIEFAAIAMMISGFLVGWRWEGIGGGLALLGFLLFCGVELIVNASLPGGAIPFFAIPGVLLLISYAISRDERSDRGTSQPAH